MGKEVLLVPEDIPHSGLQFGKRRLMYHQPRVNLCSFQVQVRRSEMDDDVLIVYQN